MVGLIFVLLAFIGMAAILGVIEVNIIATNPQELVITDLEDSDLILSISIGNGF